MSESRQQIAPDQLEWTDVGDVSFATTMDGDRIGVWLDRNGEKPWWRIDGHDGSAASDRDGAKRFAESLHRIHRDEERRAKQAAANRLTPEVFKGVDLRAEAWRYARWLKIKVPPLRFRYGVSHGVSGHAKRLQKRVVLTIGVDASANEVREALLHELVHVALDREREAHGERFRSLLTRSARALFGVPVNGWTTIKRGDRKNAAYALDALIIREMDERDAAAEAAP